MSNLTRSISGSIHGDPWDAYLGALTPIRLIALLVVYVATWLLLTPYAGLTHDAQVYAFQALARHDPEGLGQDIFLRFQSQDAYTVFPALYAWLIAAIGPESAAAVLTFAFHWMWFVAAFLIARELLGTRLALLALGLLIAIPAPYGGQRVFHLAEPFLTARLPAEVLSLLAIWAFLARRRILGAGFICMALLVHPLMAFPAALLCGFLWADEWRPNKVTIPLLSAAVVCLAVVGSYVLGGDSAVMSPDWVATAHSRSAFLFLDRWLPVDWNHTLLSLLTVMLAIVTKSSGSIPRLARSALFLGLAGLVLAFIASELLHLKLLMQGQPWRWLWPVRFLAIVSLPATVFAIWHRGGAGQGAALLLVSAWLTVSPVGTRSTALTMMPTILAVAAIILCLAGSQVPESTRTLARRGGLAVLAVVLGAVIVIAALGLAVSAKQGRQNAAEVTRVVLNLITPAVILLTLTWYALIRLRRPATAGAILVAGLGALVFAAPLAAEKWTMRQYENARQSFADWRALIPQHAEVFWWDGLREVWFLLDRRSYLTLSQGGGVVFSPQVSAELRRRAQVTKDFVHPGYWFNEAAPGDMEPRTLTHGILASTCRDPELGFVVSTDDIGLNAPRAEWPTPGHYVYLYDCAIFRSG